MSETGRRESVCFLIKYSFHFYSRKNILGRILAPHLSTCECCFAEKFGSMLQALHNGIAYTAMYSALFWVSLVMVHILIHFILKTLLKGCTVIISILQRRRLSYMEIKKHVQSSGTRKWQKLNDNPEKWAPESAL